MKKWILGILVLGAISMYSCGDDDTDFGYQIQILSPESEAKELEDVIPIRVVFESSTGDIVHNIQVKIFEKGNHENIIYNHEQHAHVVGSFEHLYEIKLDEVITESNGTTWVLEASVWPPIESDQEEHVLGEHEESHSDGDNKIVSIIAFVIN